MKTTIIASTCRTLATAQQVGMPKNKVVTGTLILTITIYRNFYIVMKTTIIASTCLTLATAQKQGCLRTKSYRHFNINYHNLQKLLNSYENYNHCQYLPDFGDSTETGLPKNKVVTGTLILTITIRTKS